MSKDKLNLRTDAVKFYWQGQDPRMRRVLEMMEEVEPWALDDIEEVSDKLVDFGRTVVNVSNTKLMDYTDEMILLMAYLVSSRSLRIMSWLDAKYSGLTFHYVMAAKGSDENEAHLLIDRLKTLKSLSLLSIVFSPQRFMLINSLLENKN